MRKEDQRPKYPIRKKPTNTRLSNYDERCTELGAVAMVQKQMIRDLMAEL